MTKRKVHQAYVEEVFLEHEKTPAFRAMCVTTGWIGPIMARRMFDINADDALHRVVRYLDWTVCNARHEHYVVKR